MSAKQLPTHDVFLDLETGGLGHGARAWEVGMVIDTPAGEELHHYYVSDFNPAHADPIALQMNGFYDRHPLHRLTGIGQPAEPHSVLAMDDHGLPAGDPDAAPPMVHTGCWPEAIVARTVSWYLRNARLCIINPAYDKPIMRDALHTAGLEDTSYYTPVCIGSYAAGVLGIDPAAGSSNRIAEALGVNRADYGTEHSALADGLYARAVLRAAEARAGVKPAWMVAAGEDAEV